MFGVDFSNEGDATYKDYMFSELLGLSIIGRKKGEKYMERYGVAPKKKKIIHFEVRCRWLSTFLL